LSGFYFVGILIGSEYQRKGLIYFCGSTILFIDLDLFGKDRTKNLFFLTRISFQIKLGKVLRYRKTTF
jgi:hypothetical protein